MQHLFAHIDDEEGRIMNTKKKMEKGKRREGKFLSQRYTVY